MRVLEEDPMGIQADVDAYCTLQVHLLMGALPHPPFLAAESVFLLRAHILMHSSREISRHSILQHTLLAEERIVWGLTVATGWHGALPGQRL